MLDVTCDEQKLTSTNEEKEKTLNTANSINEEEQCHSVQDAIEIPSELNHKDDNHIDNHKENVDSEPMNSSDCDDIVNEMTSNENQNHSECESNNVLIPNNESNITSEAEKTIMNDDDAVFEKNVAPTESALLNNEDTNNLGENVNNLTILTSENNENDSSSSKNIPNEFNNEPTTSLEIPSSTCDQLHNEHTANDVEMINLANEQTIDTNSTSHTDDNQRKDIVDTTLNEATVLKVSSENSESVALIEEPEIKLQTECEKMCKISDSAMISKINDDDVIAIEEQTDEKEPTNIDPIESESKAETIVEQTDNDLFDLLKYGNDMESPTNESENENEKMKTNEIDELIENEAKALDNEKTMQIVPQIEDESKNEFEATSNQSNETTSNQSIQEKENNLLEVCDSPQSNPQSCEGSLSSFRDEYDSNANEFASSGIDTNNENSIDVHSESNDKNGELHLDNSTNGIEIEEANEDKDIKEFKKQILAEWDENESTEIDTATTAIVEKKDSIEENGCEAKQEEMPSAEKPKEDPVLINLDDDDDVNITSEVPNETIESNEEVDADCPPAKRMRLDSSEQKEINLELSVSTKNAENSNNKNVNDSAVEAQATLQPEATVQVENDDDEIVMIVEETPETEIIVTKKRVASPVAIDDENEQISKKLKAIETDLDVVAQMSEKELKTPEPALDVAASIKEEKLEEKPSIKSDTEIQKIEPPKLSIDKIELTPKPIEVEKRTIALKFMKQFKKQFTEMSRKDLEELVLGKIVEAIVHKSEYSELKQKVECQEQVIQTFRTKVQELTKQYRDLEMVYARLKKDLEIKNQNIVTPIKITRAVGLHVCLQKSSPKESPSLAYSLPSGKNIPKPMPKTMPKTVSIASNNLMQNRNVITTTAATNYSTQQKNALLQRQAIAQRQTRQIQPAVKSIPETTAPQKVVINQTRVVQAGKILYATQSHFSLLHERILLMK